MIESWFSKTSSFRPLLSVFSAFLSSKRSLEWAGKLNVALYAFLTQSSNLLPIPLTNQFQSPGLSHNLIS